MLESHFAALNKSVDELDRKMTTGQHELMAQMISANADIVAKIDGIREKSTASGRTNWPVLLSAAGVIITVMSAVLVYTTRPLEVVNAYQSERISGLESDVRAGRDATARDRELLMRVDERLRGGAGSFSTTPTRSGP